MNAFIVTSKGFVASVNYNREENMHVVNYTEKLRDAFKYKGVVAHRVIEKHNIDGFVWLPYKETPGTKDWVVVKSETFWSDEDFPCWKAVSRTSIPYSDNRFLNSKGKDDEAQGYSKETAIKLAIQKNDKSMKALSDNVEFLQKKNEKLLNNEVY